MKRSLTHKVLTIVAGVGIAVASLGAQAPAPAPAQAGRGSNQSEEKGKDSGGGSADRMGQATALVSYARQNESPVAMLTAVQMMRGIRVQDGKQRVGTKAQEGRAGGAAAGRKTERPAPTVDAAALLNEAKGWAKGNQPVLALLDAELARPAASGTLGVTSGVPIRHVDQVLPGRTDVYTMSFVGGAVARVAVVGDGDTDLDLYIRDEGGNLITKDDDYTDDCIVQWTPRWTGQFKVYITNRGGVYNQYTLLTN